MKFPLILPFVLATVLATTPLLAKPEATDTPTVQKAVEMPVPPGEVIPNLDPAKQVDAFFQVLIEGRVQAAYDQLLRGTIIQGSTEVVNLKAMTERAIKAYGDIIGYETTESKYLGTRLVRVTCYSTGKRLPLRWRFYFYKPIDSWKLIDIRASDRLAEMFDEPVPEVSGTAK